MPIEMESSSKIIMKFMLGKKSDNLTDGLLVS